MAKKHTGSRRHGRGYSRSSGRRSRSPALESQAAEELAGGTEASTPIGDTARRATRAASSLASEAGGLLQGFMDRQVEAGAEVVGSVGDAVRAAGEILEDTVPALSDLMHDAADRVIDFSESVRERTAGELLDDAQDYVRRRPAVMFGIAAMTGFIAYRLLGPSYWDRDDDETDDDEIDDDENREDQSLDRNTPRQGIAEPRAAYASAEASEPVQERPDDLTSSSGQSHGK